MINKKTLVLGASLNPERYAFKAIEKLVKNGHSVWAIGQTPGKVAGINIVTEKIHLEDIDTITIYLNPSHQLEYYDYIIKSKPKRVIFNPETENAELAKILSNNNIYVEESCTLVLLGTHQY
jgi:predicted CoA-binding protein